MVRDDLTVNQMDNLPEGSVILDGDNDAWQKCEDEWFAYGEAPLYSLDLWAEYGPIALVWEGENG